MTGVKVDLAALKAIVGASRTPAMKASATLAVMAAG